jgi:hypothetical protein
MSQHYASADVGRLLKLANLVLHRAETRCTGVITQKLPSLTPQ